MANNNNKDKCNVPHLRFPEFTGEWKMATFGDIAKGFDYGMNAAAKSFGKYLNRDKSPICNMMKRTEFWISFIP